MLEQFVRPVAQALVAAVVIVVAREALRDREVGFLARARLGAPKAITATAHKLARLVYSMLRYGTAYVDAGQQAYEHKYRNRVLTNLQRKAKAFGYQLVHVEDIDGGLASTL